MALVLGTTAEPHKVTRTLSPYFTDEYAVEHTERDYNTWRVTP